MRREEGRFRGIAFVRVCGRETESGEEVAEGDVFEGDGTMGRIIRVIEAGTGARSNQGTPEPLVNWHCVYVNWCIPGILAREDGGVSIDKILSSFAGAM